MWEKKYILEWDPFLEIDFEKAAKLTYYWTDWGVGRGDFFSDTKNQYYQLIEKK